MKPARQAIVVRGHYRDYHDELRDEFMGQCGYCTLCENELNGLGIEIDHYWPVSLCPGLEHEYYNLIYACEKCNSSKHDFPTIDEMRAGRRVFHPPGDERARHFVVNENGRVEPIDKAIGEYTYERLRLWRGGLRRVLEQRSRAELAIEVVREGIAALRGCKLDTLNKKARAYLLNLAGLLEEEIADKIGGDRLLEQAALSPLRDRFSDDNAREKLRSVKLAEVRRLGARRPGGASKRKRRGR